jgi:hypothetical protein
MGLAKPRKRGEMGLFVRAQHMATHTHDTGPQPRKSCSVQGYDFTSLRSLICFQPFRFQERLPEREEMRRGEIPVNRECPNRRRFPPVRLVINSVLRIITCTNVEIFSDFKTSASSSSGSAGRCGAPGGPAGGEKRNDPGLESWGRCRSLTMPVDRQERGDEGRWQGLRESGRNTPPANPDKGFLQDFGLSNLFGEPYALSAPPPPPPPPTPLLLSPFWSSSLPISPTAFLTCLLYSIFCEIIEGNQERGRKVWPKPQARLDRRLASALPNNRIDAARHNSDPT